MVQVLLFFTSQFGDIHQIRVYGSIVLTSLNNNSQKNVQFNPKILVDCGLIYGRIGTVIPFQVSISCER